ncbi:MAG: hypothetical protein HY958_12015 [Bacteroidia bacterium]|nr:hypothetical protein [Bacteroidia bacterium]
MKKYRLLLLIISISITGSLFYGCKKGPDDPFFSFRTRKARVAGDYVITGKTLSYKTTWADGTQDQTDLIISGTTQTETIKYLGVTSVLGGDSVRINTFPKLWNAKGTILQYKMSFDKKGLFNGIYEYKIVATLQMPDTTPAYTRKVTYTYRNEFRGSWDFLSGVDKYKKKERIGLIYEDNQVTETRITTITYEEGIPPPPAETWRHDYDNKYANGEKSEVLHIRELRHKKMVFEQDINDYQTENSAFVYSRAGSMIETLEEQAE